MPQAVARNLSGNELIALSEWSEHSGEGLLLAVDDEPEPRFAKARVIAIDFPAFTDGRGLSLAILLRTRFDFVGELRAVGDVQPDLIHYLRRCGFDTFVVSGNLSDPIDSDDSQTQATLAPYSDYYQACVLEPQPAYRRTRRGA